MSEASPYRDVNTDSPTIRRILRTAATCFGRLGYRGSSLVEIAREAGVSKSLLHYHFDSKAHLFLACELMLCREVLDHVRALAEGQPRTIAGFETALSHVLHFLERDFEQIISILEMRTVAAEHPRVADQLEAFNEEVMGLVEEGVKNVLGPMVDRLIIPPDRVARLVLTLFNGLLVDLAVTTGDASRELVRETFLDATKLFSAALFADVS